MVSDRNLCRRCRGTGKVDVVSAARCSMCKGSGLILTRGEERNCSFCRGTGETRNIVPDICPAREGSGWE